MLDNPQFEGSEATHNEPGIERAHRRAIKQTNRVDLFDGFFIRNHNSGSHITMSAQIFGGAVSHNIGTKQQWLADHGSSKRVVNNQLRAMQMRYFCDFSQVD